VDVAASRKRLRTAREPRKPSGPAAQLARALEWQRQLDAGEVGSRAEIARREGISRARVTQTMRARAGGSGSLDDGAHVWSASAETPSMTATPSTMADVVIDANVLVGLLDENDSLFAQATALLARLDAEGHVPIVLDVLLGEAVSVLCRRATERKTSPPDLSRAIDQARRWLDGGEVAFVGHGTERSRTGISFWGASAR
jgi:hypothetical protein